MLLACRHFKRLKWARAFENVKLKAAIILSHRFIVGSFDNYTLAILIAQRTWKSGNVVRILSIHDMFEIRQNRRIQAIGYRGLKLADAGGNIGIQFVDFISNGDPPYEG